MQAILLAALAVVLVVNVVVLRFLVPPQITTGKGYQPPVYKSLSSVKILDGMMPLSARSTVRRNTYNPIASDYLHLPASSDPERGGFSYSMWMKLKLTASSHLATTYSVPILLRGNEKTVTYDNKEFVTLAQGPKISVRITNARDIFFVVNANTVHNPDFVHEFRSPEIQKLTSVDWVLVTFVFKENRIKIGSTRTSAGFQIDMYLNHRLADSVDVTNDALIPSPDDIMVLPNVKVSASNMSHDALGNLDGYLADVQYHNYALTGVDVDRLYAAGFRRTPFRPIKLEDSMRRAREYSVVSMENEIRMLQHR